MSVRTTRNIQGTGSQPINRRSDIQTELVVTSIAKDANIPDSGETLLPDLRTDAMVFVKNPSDKLAETGTGKHTLRIGAGYAGQVINVYNRCTDNASPTPAAVAINVRVVKRNGQLSSDVAVAANGRTRFIFTETQGWITEAGVPAYLE